MTHEQTTPRTMTPEFIRERRLDSARELALIAANRILAAQDHPSEVHAALWRLIAVAGDLAGIASSDAEKLTDSIENATA